MEPGGGLPAPLATFPVGGRVNLRVDSQFSVGLFAGYELAPAVRLKGLLPAHGLVGRGTVSVTW